ncbi:MAG: Uncharacterised protein [Candidatus Nitrosopelagicus brevis]|nr:MAG: Uncharacterised protein [Candidatus Nitrosopelagicus brevis]
MVFERRIFVVSINGLESPKLESVTIPASFPFNGTDLLFASCNEKDTKSIDSLSPNEIR